ncbi:putative protein isoform X1 [Capsicum annuum]|uniref:uncharacterized protein LOC107863390 isoform X1 n=1 Tax=Capsicum annuum TaxID=4072 RepID=UPI001FB16FA1|nr:uncharacterized protein LOC107863390 isoform X1 [Capsicum annuum]XP_016564770.2 uncharacterized protein LOC107863390 isoform X1 [Capsicum annuum]
MDDHGFVNLSETLKVTTGYGKPDEVVFKKAFQTERRSLRLASKVLEVYAIGSHLEDVVFEVINSAGEVDEDIDGEEEDGCSHTLLIRQDLSREEDNVQVDKVVINTHEVTQPRSPKKEILLLEDSYSLKGPGMVYDNPNDGSIMLFKDSCAFMDLENRQKLGDDICRYALHIRECEENLE